MSIECFIRFRAKLEISIVMGQEGRGGGPDAILLNMVMKGKQFHAYFADLSAGWCSICCNIAQISIILVCKLRKLDSNESCMGKLFNVQVQPCHHELYATQMIIFIHKCSYTLHFLIMNTKKSLINDKTYFVSTLSDNRLRILMITFL